MARRRLAQRRLVQLGAVSVGCLLAMALSSCVGSLPVTVNAVTGTLEPYNPATRSSGIPAEQVFTVGDVTFGSTNLVCLIDVRHDGVMVGTALATIGYRAGTSTPRGVDESVAVDVSLPSPFDGTPSDATVSCVTGK